jgi:hypothetical protein
MTVFSCCGFPSRKIRERKGNIGDSHSSASSSASDHFPYFSPEGFSGGFNSSMEVTHGSLQEGTSRMLSSKVSHVSYSCSLRDRGRIDRQASACRSSLNSVASSVREDSDDCPEEIVRLRRALDLTEKELYRTETELTEALIALAREREVNRKQNRNCKASSHLLHGIFHGSPKTERHTSRRRSGSCPQVLSVLPHPTSAAYKYSTIKCLLSP